MTKIFENKSALSLMIAAFFCILLFAVGSYCRPLFPVDETRYVTVAWEMFSTGDWVLPHLNYEAYDHKPPLLFWSINLLWLIFGVSQEAAMAVPFIYAFAFVCASNRLAKRLIPEDPNFPALVTYVLIGSLPFIVYSNMIMFDLVLGVFSTLGITAIWDYATTGKRKHLFIFALAVGLGAITKGPVILLHTIFPILFVKFWACKNDNTPTRKQWAAGFTAAILGGTLLGLCWAIPAAIKGGPAFADKIFWGQTAGRVTNAFDHKEPFWWYFMFLPIFLAPWAFSPLLWRGLKRIKSSDYKNIFKFLGIWIPPVFLCFCFISGKQVHYLIPLLPGIAIFTALTFKKAKDTYALHDALLPFIICGLLILSPFLIKTAALYYPHLLNGRPLLTDVLAKVSLTIPLLLFMLSAISVFFFSRKGLNLNILAISLSSLLVMVCFQFEAKDGLFKNYDLRPIADVVKKNPEVPMAFARNYHGEWGFMARLHHPVTQLEPEYLPEWFEKHPNGMAFMRTGHPEETKPYDVIFTMPYKTDNTYNILVKRGEASHFSK